MIQGLTHISDRRQSQPQTEEAFAIRARRRGWLKDILYDVRQLLSCAAPCAPRQRLDPEIVELFPGSKLCSQPARLFPATRPSLGRLGGIAIFRKHLRVRAPRMSNFLRIVRCCTQVELPQLPIDFHFFG